MATKAYGRMVFWEGASLWVLGTRPGEGPYPKTEFHAHHAVQVTLSLRGWFTLENRDRQVGGEGGGGGRAGHRARARGRRNGGPPVHRSGRRAGTRAAAHVVRRRDPRVDSGAESGRAARRLRAGFESPHRNDRSLIELSGAPFSRSSPRAVNGMNGLKRGCGECRPGRPGGSTCP